MIALPKTLRASAALLRVPGDSDSVEPLGLCWLLGAPRVSRSSLTSEVVVSQKPIQFRLARASDAPQLQAIREAAFMPVFEYIQQHQLKCSLLIYLTDGYGENPRKPEYVKYPVIWVTTHANPASWGKIIKMEQSEDDTW